MRKSGVVVFWLALLLTGCVEDSFDSDGIIIDSIQPGVNFPLANVNLSIGDILDDEVDSVVYYLDEDGNERLKFMQTQNPIDSLGLSQLFSVSSQSVDMAIDISGLIPQISLPFSQGLKSTTVDLPPIKDSIGFVVPSANVLKAIVSTRLKLEAGEMPVGISLVASFPTIIIDDQPLVIVDWSKSVDLAHAEIGLVNNKIPLEINVAFQGDPLNLTAVDPIINVKLGLDTQNLALHYLQGSMGENTVSIDPGIDTLALDVMADFDMGIRFTDPRFKVLLFNETPFSGLLLPDFKGKNKEDEQLVLDFSGVEVGMSSAPLAGGAVRDVIALNRDNSNIDDFLYFMPDYVSYGGAFVLNPGAENGNVVELFEDDFIKVGYQLEVPMEFTMDTRLEVDTLDLSSDNLLEDVTAATLIIESTNGFPLAASAKLRFFDSKSGSVLDEIDANIINAGKIGDDGVVVEATGGLEEIALTESQIANLNQSDKILVEMHLVSSDFIEGNHPDSPGVVLLTSYELDLKFRIKSSMALEF